MPKKFEGYRPPEEPEEKMEVRPETEIPRDKEKYSKTTDFFESYAKDFPEQLEQAKGVGDSGAVSGIEKARKECDGILESLKDGDTNPAIEKIGEMIERNFEFLKGELPDTESPEKRIEILKELIDYLAELKGVETESKELHEIKGLVNDYSKLENINRSKRDTETMVEYEKLGAVEFLNELTTEDLEKFVAVRPDGSKNLTASPIYDESGNFTGRYKIYEQKPEVINQKSKEIEEIAERVKKDHEKSYIVIEEERLKIMEQQIKQGRAEDLGEVTLAELYSQHPDFKASEDVLISLFDGSGRRIEGKYKAFKWTISTAKEKI